LYPPWIASMANTDVATIQLLARETPGAMFNALQLAEKFENDAVVSLLRKCLAAWEHSNISALIDLCDESNRLKVFKEYVERHPVHHAARSASGIAIIKPVIRAHAGWIDPCDALAAIYESKYGKAPKQAHDRGVHAARERRCWGCRAMLTGRRGWRRWSCAKRQQAHVE